jgi:hypothetical protein
VTLRRILGLWLTQITFGKNILSDGDLKKAAPFTRKLHTFYMQCGKSDDASDIMIALRPGTNAWLKRDESSNALQLMPVLSDLYDLFNLDALDLTLLPLLHPVSCLKI